MAATFSLAFVIKVLDNFCHVLQLMQFSIRCQKSGPKCSRLAVGSTRPLVFTPLFAEDICIYVTSNRGASQCRSRVVEGGGDRRVVAGGGDRRTGEPESPPTRDFRLTCFDPRGPKSSAWSQLRWQLMPVEETYGILRSRTNHWCGGLSSVKAGPQRARRGGALRFCHSTKQGEKRI